MRGIAVFAATIGVLGAGATAAHAEDGVLIVHVITSGHETVTHRAQIGRTRIRTEMIQDARQETVVFDRTAQIMRLIDDPAKTYSEIKVADADRVGGHMADALRELKRQAQTASPADRPRIEAMISGLMGPPLEYTRLAADRVGTWACEKYSVTRKGEKVADVCIAEPAALGFTAQDLEMLKPFAEFYAQVTKGGEALLFNVGLTGPPGSLGIAVSLIGPGGAAQGKTMLTVASREMFQDSLFAVPAGYARREFPGMR